MKYKLMRSYLNKTGTLCIEMIFDLWNYEYEVGYEIKINLWNMTSWINHLEKYCRELIGHNYDISRWDLIIRNIKQMKLSDWKVFEEGEKNGTSN